MPASSRAEYNREFYRLANCIERGRETACAKCGTLRLVGQRCKPCKSKARKAWPSNSSAAQAAYRAAHPGCRTGEGARLYRKNPAAQRAKRRAWYAANRDKAKGLIAAYRKAHPELKLRLEHRRRARKVAASGYFTSAEWSAIKQRQHGRCADCRQKCKLTVDHIIPLSRGGSNFAFNIQGLCGPCNSRKHASVKAGAQHSLFDKVAA